MTFAEFALKFMTDRGMFDDDAAKVLTIIQDDDKNAAMLRRWKDPIEGYPQAMQTLMKFSISASVNKWLAENRPEAWYREMFKTGSAG